MLIALLIACALVGVYLLWRGWRGVRVGTVPHCRRCDYNLTGLTESRCPECGTPFDAQGVARGQRQRSPRRIAAGIVFLVAAAALGPPQIRDRITRTWRRQWPYCMPTFLLVRELQDENGYVASWKVRVLWMRARSGYVEKKHLQVAAGPLLEAAALTIDPSYRYYQPKLLVVNTLGDMLYAGALSPKQTRAFFRLISQPRLRHPLPKRWRHTSLEPPFMLRIPEAEGLVPCHEIHLISIDGQPARERLSRDPYLVPWSFGPAFDRPALQHEFVIRLTTTWYDFGQRPPRTQHRGGYPYFNYRDAILELNPKVWCVITRDIRFSEADDWQLHVIAEYDDPATMPAP